MHNSLFELHTQCFLWCGSAPAAMAISTAFWDLAKAESIFFSFLNPACGLTGFVIMITSDKNPVYK